MLSWAASECALGIQVNFFDPASGFAPDRPHGLQQLQSSADVGWLHPHELAQLSGSQIYPAFPKLQAPHHLRYHCLSYRLLDWRDPCSNQSPLNFVPILVTSIHGAASP